jgi:hypothetical protein
VCEFNASILSLTSLRPNFNFTTCALEDITIKKNCISNGKLAFKTSKFAISKWSCDNASSKYDATSSKTDSL